MLNQATYFEMKARAGTIGAALAAVIDREVPQGVRVHLVGHSFGGRLVTSTASAMRTPVRSLSLLQAAFSHNAFGTGIGRRKIDGGFRRVVADGVVSGPIMVTHTRRDTAVGIFYAIASSVSGEIAKGMVTSRLVGGPADLHGGLGANGALAMNDGEAVVHVATVGETPDLVCAKVNNVLCDAIIGGHSDVANPDVGALVWRALSA
ncbi:hypothetical protein E5673_14780 [Sphingomonas sp. PAMC26645]|uniref:hypothetical protein n=1 Tax=Sphingomonas sp. PAMC26645 TaxID=2565555 RepID=UPI00109E0A88|nr:hypothetical protein [Sphingomonas sp. PAMC26645]QCB43334.1 hypothetical protein E5673_14780 [Sphingomonas sp. PAMC26645]